MKLDAAAIAVPILILFVSQASAFDADTKRQLMRLAPRARLEQTCDTETMLRIAGDRNPYHPDKVIAYTFKDPVYSHDEVEAPGAVFRSGGNWYHLSYTCRTGPKHLDVQELHYEIGARISHSEWKSHLLYN